MRLKFNRILCATDFSDYSNRTVSLGMALAREFQAKLYICHVVELHVASMYAEAYIDPMELRRLDIESASQQIQEWIEAEDVDGEPVVTVGSAADDIPQIVREKQIDLVIAATYGRSGWKRFLLGSVTESLMRTLECPLIVVGSRESAVKSPETDKFQLNRILVGCDFSSDSDLALQYAFSLAQEFQSELILAHVVEAPGRHTPYPIDAAADVVHKEGMERLLNLRLSDMVPKEAPDWCEPKTLLLRGKPYEEMASYAEDNAVDLIVLGIRGHGLIETFLVGSTTDRVIRQAPCPVLAVWPIPEETAQQTTEGTGSAAARSMLDVSRDFFVAETRDDIAVVRLERDLYQQLTHLSARDAFLEYLERLSGNNDIKALVLLGSSEKTGREEYVDFYRRIFHSKAEPHTLQRLLNAVDQVLLRLANLNKAVVHVDTGRVLPLFLNLSLACDYRIVSEKTVFENPCTELGLIPMGGGAFFLPPIVGRRKAFEILLSGENLPGETARKLGIVDEVVVESDLEAAAMAAARRFSCLPASSVSAIKRLLNHTNRGLNEYLAMENEELMRIVAAKSMG